MGAIQSAVNQGITTAAILGQLNELPQARKEEKTASKLLDMASEQSDRAFKAVNEARKKDKSLSDEELKAIDEQTQPYNELIGLAQEASKKVALRSGNTDIYRLASQLKPVSKLYDPEKEMQAKTQAQEQFTLARKQKMNRQSLLDMPISIKNEKFGTVGDLPRDIQRQIEGELRNGRK